LGPYEIVTLLGAGGMGEVYRARDLRLERFVALKVLPPHLGTHAGLLERFQREARAVAALNHPNICTIYDVDTGANGNPPYIAMELLEGETLHWRLLRGALPLAEVIEVGAALADALDAAHAKGIIHRDIKPANIVLTARGPKILDFGLAKATAGSGSASATAMRVSDAPLTALGAMVGTVAYMSPEQLRGEPLDARSDLFSFGLVLYEMATGRPAFSGATSAVISAAILHEAPAAPRTFRPELPPPLEDTVLKALEKDRALRCQSAAELRADLKRLAARTSGSAAMEAAVATPPARAPSAAVPPAAREAAARRPRAKYAATAVLAATLGAAAVWQLGRDPDGQWLREDAIPRIEASLDVGDWEAAFAVMQEAQARVPDDRALAELWPRLSWRVTLDSDPPGAAVSRRGYNATGADWQPLGRTPVDGVRIPFGLSQLRLELDGYVPLLRTLGSGLLPAGAELPSSNPSNVLRAGDFSVLPELFKLDTPVTLPEGKVRVSGWSQPLNGQNVELRDYFLDRDEVTNAEFKEFVDAGGYRQPNLWDPVVRDGAVVPWEEAMALFLDRTGRPGPSTWEAGDYPDGRGSFPVSGVSWYEAAAYARFRGEELPTLHHWRRASPQAELPWLLPVSNLDAPAPLAVGESGAVNYSGTLDMLGNVREWTATASGEERYVLGGSWADLASVATVDATAPPLDRSPSNGFRLAATFDEAAVAALARAPVQRALAVMAPAQPVSDEVYAAYTRAFAYEPTPLNASIDAVQSTRVWTRQRISFDAAYGSERVVLYMYLPTAGAPPYRTVIYWPGASAMSLSSIDEYAMYLDFVLKSGRAVAFPVYQGTFERRRIAASSGAFGSRDDVIAGVKDLKRTVDYLETRSDVDRGFVYFGHSWGGLNGPAALAQEPRIRTAIIYVGFLASTQPEIDPVNALPRVRIPVLMLSSEFDIVPLENARRYFELLGTPAADKKHVISSGGHFLPRDVLIRETLDWLDAH
jgi:hypothetical protein